MSDELPATSIAAPPSSGSGVPAPAPSSTVTEGTGSSPAGGGTAPAQPAATTATPQDAWSLTSYLQQQGVKLAAPATDDRTAAQQLLQQYQAAQQQAQYGQLVAPYWSQFQEFLTQQQAQKAQQPATTEQSPWWQEFWQPPVQWDRSQEQFLTVDESGQVQAQPGAPPDLVHKYQQYRHWRNEQTQKLLDNPHAFIEQPVKHLARQIAAEEIQRYFSQQQAQQQAQQFVGANDAWLYERDASSGAKRTQLQMGQDGQLREVPVLSVWGQLLQQEAQRLHQAGLKDQTLLQEYALARVQAEYARRQFLSPAPGAAAPAEPVAGAPGVPGGTPAAPAADPVSEAVKKAFTTRAARRSPSHAGSPVPPVPATTTGQANPHRHWEALKTKLSQVV